MSQGRGKALGALLYDSFRSWWALCFLSFLRVDFCGMMENVIA